MNEITTVSGVKVSGLRPGLSLEMQHIMANAPELLEAVKLAYRKHHLGDPDIGWDELSEKLLDALCNAMGADGFVQWLHSLGHEDD